MQRIDPALPDLLPIEYRLGLPPEPLGATPVFDPVEARLVWVGQGRRAPDGEHGVPRRVGRFLVHAAVAAGRKERVGQLFGEGFGALIVLDGPLAPSDMPAPCFAGQIVVMAPWFPRFWGGSGIPDLSPWRQADIEAGVLVGLGPTPRTKADVADAVVSAQAAGARFVVPGPIGLTAEERHCAYDREAGEAGDGLLEDLLFHTDLAVLAMELERELTRAARPLGLGEGLPGPATVQLPSQAAAAVGQLLLWARRLDLLDGVSSTGWQLRRAAQALMAARRDPAVLVADDNLRIIPGFAPWVEAFARSLWANEGSPFDEILARWVAE